LIALLFFDNFDEDFVKGRNSNLKLNQLNPLIDEVFEDLIGF
jgi:hypothetical protein